MKIFELASFLLPPIRPSIRCLRSGPSICSYEDDLDLPLRWVQFLAIWGFGCPFYFELLTGAPFSEVYTLPVVGTLVQLIGASLLLVGIFFIITLLEAWKGIFYMVLIGLVLPLIVRIGIVPFVS